MEIVRIGNGRVIRNGHEILGGIQLSLSKGEFIYLCGQSGSGKTSLLSALYGASSIEADEAVVCGEDLTRLTPEALPSFRRKIGMIFQDFKLFDDKTVRSNLYIVLKATGWEDEDEIKKRISEALSWVGLEDKATWMPDDLSGGEKQRLSIARALLNKPALIIADEPTGNLDPDTSDIIIQLIRKLAREEGVAVLCATHDTRVVEKFPSRQVQCENGTLVHH